jgi:hypothetical protein
VARGWDGGTAEFVVLAVIVLDPVRSRTGTSSILLLPTLLRCAALCCAVLCRSNAVRVLCQIVDSQLLAQIERYLKQAVVDKSPVVAASVLVSALHLMHNVRILSLGTLGVLCGRGWYGASPHAQGAAWGDGVAMQAVRVCGPGQGAHLRGLLSQRRTACQRCYQGAASVVSCGGQCTGQRAAPHAEREAAVDG